MFFSSMDRHIAENKAKKNPIGTKPALKVGTHCKPTDNALQVDTTWEDERMWLWGPCWQLHVHNLFPLNLICASGPYLCMYFFLLQELKVL